MRRPARYTLARLADPSHDARMQVITYRGLKVHLGTRAVAFQELTNLLTSTGQHQILTLNPEYVVLASKNPALVEISQHASLCLVDGVGVALAVRRYGTLERYPGADLVPELCRYCATQQLKIGIVLRRGGLSTPESVQQTLQQKYPHVSVAAWYADDMVGRRIQQYAPVLLLNALGQPDQDLWIAKNLATFPSVHVAIGVGGAIDFLTRARRRAPRLMRALGVEWFWRLVTQPRRFVRILRATFGFWYTTLFQ